MFYSDKEIEDIRNSKKPDRRAYKCRRIKNFRDLVSYSIEHYSDNVAYKYKTKPTSKKIIEKTYKDAGSDIRAFGTAMLNRNYKSKKVGVIGKNRYEWCMSYLGITTSGMVIVPLDKLLPENELKNLVKRSGIEAVVCDGQYVESFKKFKNSQDIALKTIISMDKVNDDEVEIWSNVVKEGNRLLNEGDTKYDEVEIDENAVSVLLFTSGTTSEAKGVMLSQKNICTNIEDITTHAKMYPTDTILSVLPMHHTFESLVSFLFGFSCGITLAFCDGLRYYAQNLKDYDVSIIVAVPLLLETIYKKIQKGIDESGKREKFEKGIKISRALMKLHIDVRKKLFKEVREKLGSRIRIIYYGSAQMEKDTIQGYFDLGIVSIQGYGLTETSPILTAETDRIGRPGSVGVALPSVTLKIIDKNEEGIGEVCAKGPSVMLGYYNNDQKTKESFDDDGYFKTGDYGYIDKDGFLFLTGRKSDTIVLRNGKNIYPDEIEGLINKIPYVKESLVFARNSSKTDTLLAAKVVYDEEEFEKLYGKIISYSKKDKIVMEDIKKYVDANLADYKHIKRIILQTEEMEKTTTSKIKRNVELQKIYKKKPFKYPVKDE